MRLAFDMDDVAMIEESGAVTGQPFPGPLTIPIAETLAIVGVVATTAALVLACFTWPAPARADEPPMSITVSAGLLTLEAHDTPLQSILDEISRLSGIRVRLDEADEAQAADELVTIVLETTPVEDALRRLLPGKDFVFLYSPSALAEARVYRAGDKGPGRAAAEPANVSATPGGESPDLTSVAALRNQALSSPDPGVRSRALEGLAANVDQRAARDAVLEVLERESNPVLLQRALDIVGADRSLPVEPLVKLAIGNPAPEVRIKALTRLSEQIGGDPRARQTLEVSAADDPAPGVRQAAKTLLQQQARGN
jgi:hypothetical protein